MSSRQNGLAPGIHTRRLGYSASLALIFLIVAFGSAAAQRSPNFDLSVSALGGGGGRSASATVAVESILGQSAAGANQGPVFTEAGVTTALKVNQAGTLVAVAYCNIHGLWESSKELTIA